MKLKKSLLLTLVGHQLNLGDEVWATTLFVSPSLLVFFFHFHNLLMEFNFKKKHIQ